MLFPILLTFIELCAWRDFKIGGTLLLLVGIPLLVIQCCHLWVYGHKILPAHSDENARKVSGKKWFFSVFFRFFSKSSEKMKNIKYSFNRIFVHISNIFAPINDLFEHFSSLYVDCHLHPSGEREMEQNARIIAKFTIPWNLT